MKPLRTSGRGIRWHELKSSPPLITIGLISSRLTSRRISARPRPAKMADYNKWTKDDLIQRVKDLEKELKTQPRDKVLPETQADDQQDGVGETITTLPEHHPKKAKKPKSMDPSKWATRFIALKLAYIGKNYNGFEYQSSGARSTIEEELWKALVRACLIFPDPAKPQEVDWNVCEYSKCGRTDRGVSAFGQVVALRVRSNKPGRKKGTQGAESRAEGATATENAGLDGEVVGTSNEMDAAQENDDDDDTPLPVEQEIQYARVLNRILPPDIKVYAWCPNPPPEFSARFSCRERQYRYFFTQPVFAPLPNFLATTDENTSANGSVPKRPKDGWLDIDAMRQAAKMFEGLHDFRNFCKVDGSKQLTNFERRIYEADIVEVDGVDTSIPYLAGAQFRDSAVPPSAGERYPKVYYFHVRGSAFLWHQIRCMVAILFLVGQGLEPASVVAALLDTAAHPRRPNYVMADDAPLVLWDCVFGRDGEQGAADELDWLYVGADQDGGPLNLHGTAGVGLIGDLWANWRERKMDEILANRLLDWIAQKTDVQRVPAPAPAPAEDDEGKKVGKKVTSTRLFEGGNGPKFAGTYMPVMRMKMLQSPGEINDKYAQRKGFKNAEEMRARGNWREEIRAAKEAGSNTGKE